MDELQKLALKIDELRVYLQNLIEEKENLSDKQIMHASEALDSLLNEYGNLQKQSETNNSLYR